MLGEHSATELATLEPLGSIPIRPILGAESPLPCSHACTAPSGASHLTSACRKKLLSVARVMCCSYSWDSLSPAPGASEYKIHKRKYKIYTGSYINIISTQEVACCFKAQMWGMSQRLPSGNGVSQKRTEQARERQAEDAVITKGYLTSLLKDRTILCILASS